MNIMEFALMRPTVALALLLAFVAPAQAGWFNKLGRHLGLGWSDGYHAQGQCTPPGGNDFAIPPGGFVPQGPILVPEPQPTPAHPPPENLPVPRTTAHRPSAAGGTSPRW
jgi:hypothetical protein